MIGRHIEQQMPPLVQCDPGPIRCRSEQMTTRPNDPFQDLKDTIIIVQVLEHLKHAYYVKSGANIDGPQVRQGRTTLMLWTIIAILLVLWLLGLIGHIGGGLIHLLLVIALIMFIVNLFTGRTTTV